MDINLNNIMFLIYGIIVIPYILIHYLTTKKIKKEKEQFIKTVKEILNKRRTI